MRSFIHIIGVLTLLTCLGLKAEEAPRIPNEFVLKEKFFALTTSFDMLEGDKKVGKINKRVFSFKTTYDYYDANGKLVATASKRIFSWGVHIDVYDPAGKKIGEIKEQVFRSLFKAWTVYTINDGDGKQVAESEKVEMLATKFTLTDRKNYLVATIDRPWLRLMDRWRVKIADTKTIDPRVLVMIGVYKTDADNARSSD